MSANLDLVRSMFAAWERGHFFRPAKWAHPDIEFVITGGPDPGGWTGVAGMAEGFRDFLDAWEDFGVEAEEYRELDDERVLVLIRRSGRGKTSRLEVTDLRTEAADLFHIRDGKVTRFVAYWDREHAFADLGLEDGVGDVGEP
jgi:ketosteroid isomerase-like protein